LVFGYRVAMEEIEYTKVKPAWRRVGGRGQSPHTDCAESSEPFEKQKKKKKVCGVHGDDDCGKKKGEEPGGITSR